MLIMLSSFHKIVIKNMSWRALSNSNSGTQVFYWISVGLFISDFAYIVIYMIFLILSYWFQPIIRPYKIQQVHKTADLMINSVTASDFLVIKKKKARCLSKTAKLQSSAKTRIMGKLFFVALSALKKMCRGKVALVWLFNFSASQLRHRMTVFWVLSTKRSEEVTRQVSGTGILTNRGTFEAVPTKDTTVFVVYFKSLNILCPYVYIFHNYLKRTSSLSGERTYISLNLNCSKIRKHIHMGLLGGSDVFWV